MSQAVHEFGQVNRLIGRKGLNQFAERLTSEVVEGEDKATTQLARERLERLVGPERRDALGYDRAQPPDAEAVMDGRPLSRPGSRASRARSKSRTQ